MNSSPIPSGDIPMSQLMTPSSFQYSAVDLSTLANLASKYTLVTIVIDVSGSVYSFRDTLEHALREIIGACKKDPSANSQLVRLILFNDTLQEIHGFKPVNSINENDYNGIISPGGNTALFDAMRQSVEAAVAYAAVLAQQAYTTNAITIVVTDGKDSGYGCGAGDVARTNDQAISGESLESSQIVLLGLTEDLQFGTYLEKVRTDCKIDKTMIVGTFVAGGPTANRGKIAKLLQFVSHSVSSTAQALGSGGPSKTIPAALTI